MPTAVTIPLFNPNEPEARLAALHVSEGQHINSGELIASLETTKSAGDLEAESDGYVAGLRFEAGQSVRAGDILCYLAETPDWLPPEAVQAEPAATSEPPPGLRITQPALALAREHQLDLSSLPAGSLVTETMVRERIQGEKTALIEPGTGFDASAVIIYGGGGHGKMVIDLLRSWGAYRVAGIIDDGRSRGEMVMGVPVLGGAEQLAELHARSLRLAVNAVGGIGNISVRVKIFERLAAAGFGFPILVHPRACIEPSASLQAGAQAMANSYVGSEAKVGIGCIINTGAIISHDCHLDSYVNISPGAILAGDVQLGAGAMIGMGATINLGVRIGAGARIGNGATVKTDVPVGGVVRAGAIWPE